MTRLDLTPFYRSAIGFDRMANLVDNLFQAADTSTSSAGNWPPYNIAKTGEHDYRITMAVAGFAEADLDVTLHDGMLIIKGKTSDDEASENITYLYRGIAGRQFERRFQLADFIHIKGANLKDGLLHINLVREIPEAMKPRKIEITQSANLVDLKKKKRA